MGYAMAESARPPTGPKNHGEQAVTAAGHSDKTAERTHDAASSAVKEGQDKAEGVKQKVQDAAAQAGERVRDAASALVQTAQSSYDAATERVSDFNQDVINFIKRHP